MARHALILAALTALAATASSQTVRVRLYWMERPQAPPRSSLIRGFNLEDYVAAVLAGEAGGVREPEALRAMAIAARSYARANLGRHKADGFDFCDTTHCQDLRLTPPHETIRRAVSDTGSECIWFEGKPAQGLYHRHCGGATEDAREMWPSMRAPYLRSQPDTYCSAGGPAQWTAAITARELKVLRRSPTGRAVELRHDGSLQSFEQFQRAFEPGLVRSALFRIVARDGGFQLQGHGDGHGAGLCQTGAVARARHGHSHREILAFYYPGTRTGVNAQGLSWTRLGGERVDLYTTQPSADAPRLALAGRILADAERRSGLRLSGRPQLRVYPSVAVYRDATGEPGWLAASTKAGAIRTQPLAVLAARGLVESTLLHEFLHLVVEANAHASLPLWFREGLVLYLEAPERPGVPGRAPGDGLIRSLSEAVARRAYEQARWQVRALIQRHGRDKVLGWVERGLPTTAAQHGTCCRCGADVHVCAGPPGPAWLYSARVAQLRSSFITQHATARGPAPTG